MMEKQQMQAQQAAAVDEQRESLLRAFLSPEGRERLKRIETVKPERARAVEIQIIQSVRAGKMQPPVGDDVVRELLAQASGGGGGEGGSGPKITVLRKARDDDWQK